MSCRTTDPQLLKAAKGDKVDLSHELIAAAAAYEVSPVIRVLGSKNDGWAHLGCWRIRETRRRLWQAD